MYYSRIREIKARNIDPQQLATRTMLRSTLVDSAATADNLKNQFEMPVLFYAAVLLALILMWQDPVLVTFSWIYVGLRIVHALIHTTYNDVMHRFWVYFLSCSFLLGIWIRLGWYIIFF